MAHIAVVRRYARALFNSAEQSGQIEQVEQDLETLDEALRAVPRLLRALRAPTIPASRKSEILDHAFGARMAPLTLRFLHLVVRRRRESILNNILTEYRRMANELRGILPVDVASAFPMDEAQRAELITSLTRSTGKQINLQVTLDPELMGGMVLRMGDTVIDGSLRARLNQLRNRLFAGPGL